MQVVQVNPDEPRPGRLEVAVELLDHGGVVAVPTETFYGLAADAFDAAALGRVNRLKGKAGDSPILLLLSDPAQVGMVAGKIPPHFDDLAGMFWPGPLTLVVPAAADLPREVSGGAGTVAVRVPGLVLPRRLAATLGRPISGVSANVHGKPPCRTAAEVAKVFPDGVDLVLDGGTTTAGTPSTILDLCGSRPRVIREGLLPVASLRLFLPELAAPSL